MRSLFIWLSLLGFFSAALAEVDYFSELSEEDYQKLREIAKFLRSRLQEAEAVDETIQRESNSEAETENQSSTNELKPPFEYSLPLADPNLPDGPPPFAVGPSDPRFYQNYAIPLDSGQGPQAAPNETKDKRIRAETENKVGITNADPFGNDNSTRSLLIEPLDRSTTVWESTLITLSIVGSIAGLLALIAFMIEVHKLRKKAKAAADVDYPAYGVTGPNKEISPSSGDRRLAQSAQMYHYQHQKQQIIALESMSNKDRRSSISEAESDEENEEGDYTVYECAGLALTGEMEVRNPLFQDDQTPAQKPADDSTEEPRDLPNLISFD